MNTLFINAEPNRVSCVVLLDYGVPMSASSWSRDGCFDKDDLAELLKAVLRALANSNGTNISLIDQVAIADWRREGAMTFDKDETREIIKTLDNVRRWWEH